MNPPKPVIEGIKLIKHNMGGVNLPDDPSYPFRLDAIFRVPSFMEVAASFIYGREEIVVRGMTAEKLEQFVAANSLRTHPRLTKLEITQPEVLAAAAAKAKPPVEVAPTVERQRPGLKLGSNFDCDTNGYPCSRSLHEGARGRSRR